METGIQDFSAYHGKTWQKRLNSSQTEREHSTYWSSHQTHSEYKELKSVLLYVPGEEIHQIKNPDSVQHLRSIDAKKIREEFLLIKEAFQKEKVTVFELNSAHFEGLPSVNLMYTRDLFWSGPEGAIVSRMGSLVRAGEEKYAATALSLLSVPILMTIHNQALFEGADLLWLNSTTLLCGIGNRTNQEAVKQLETLFKKNQLKIISIKLPKKVQHLLGLLQITNEKQALVRISIAPKKLINILADEQFTIIPIQETDEVIHRQGMNIVTIRPGEIFMPQNCPDLKNIYQKNNIKVLAELDISQLLAGAGGLACATGILGREK